MRERAALVLASSTDIGRAICLALSEGGYHIAAQYYQNEAAAFQLQKQVEHLGGKILLLQGDLTDKDTPGNVVRKTLEAFGGIHVLVNTIGPYVPRDLLEVTPEDWKYDMEMNLNVIFHVIFHAKASIIKSKGSIINFGYAGVQLLQSREIATPYCAAKAGLMILTKALATRLAPFGVRVNAVCPGVIDDSSVTEQRRQAYMKEIPFRRLGTPKEVAEVVLWLAQESPAYVTGALIPLAGGWEH